MSIEDRLVPDVFDATSKLSEVVPSKSPSGPVEARRAPFPYLKSATEDEAYCTVKVTVPAVPVTLPEVPDTVMV